MDRGARQERKEVKQVTGALLAATGNEATKNLKELKPQLQTPGAVQFADQVIGNLTSLGYAKTIAELLRPFMERRGRELDTKSRLKKAPGRTL
jgi:hypothetical protein